MKVALLCSGLGNVHRGHEVFATGLFDLLKDSIDITLFKGGGAPAERELVIDHIPRDSRLLDGVHLPVSPKWKRAALEVERMRIEGETFAYAALKPLLELGADVIHCLEQEVCHVVYAHRHLFPRTPKILFSNGGAIRGRDLPPCDYVQEHTAFNLSRSDPDKAFLIPHGVDTRRFRPGLTSRFRADHGIPADAFVVLSVGTICYWHKRMDYVIREIAAIPHAYLVIVGQPSNDSPEIQALGEQLMPGRILFMTVPHDELPHVYAAADVFVLGSRFETFGIVYIEAMAMGLPVVCTNHPNQRAIVQEGFFVDVMQEGAVTGLLKATSKSELEAMGRRGREIAVRDYELRTLRERYLERYQMIASAPASLPEFDLKRRIAVNLRNAARRMARALP